MPVPGAVPAAPGGTGRGQTLPIGIGSGADPTRDPTTELCLFSSLKVLKTWLLSLL